MALDRLKELQQMSNQNHVEIEIPRLDEQNENTQFQRQNSTDQMAEFSKNANLIKNILLKVQQNTKRIQEMQQQYQKATTQQQEQALSQELDQIIASNQKNSDMVKQLLGIMKEDLDNSLKNMPDEPETRMKQNQYSALGIKTGDVFKDYQQVQMNFSQGSKNKIIRQVRIIDSNLTEEQVQEIANDPEKGQQLLQEKMYGKASLQLQNAVSDIQDKHRDIIKLEKSVQACYQLFLDLSMLVHLQGEKLDNIELNVNDAKNYVEKAEKSLTQAKKDHQSSRKRMCCILLILVVILVIILAPSLAVGLK